MIGVLLAAAFALPIPAQLPTVERLTQSASPVYCAGTRGHAVALTFDDGPSPYTPALIRVLRRAHARATFFDVASRVAYWPAAVRAEARVGEIGNHTWSHPHLADLSMKDVRIELESAERTLARSTGARPRLFRPPYDQATPAIDLLARSLRLLDVRWSTDTRDSSAGTTPATVVRTAVAGLRPGAILLFHDPHTSTPAVAAAVLRAARRKGLVAVTVSDLLARQPPSIRQLRSTGAARCVP